MSEKSNELLAQDIIYIKERLESIEKRLEQKYVSHETFTLTVESINKAITTVVKTGMFIITPIYVALIGLMFKIFVE